MIALLLAAAVQAAPAPQAPPSAQPAAAQTTAERPKEDPLVCKMETQPNSRFRKRVCLPRSQREVRTDGHQAAWSAMQNRPYISLDKGN
jgi:hypothetical protein